MHRNRQANDFAAVLAGSAISLHGFLALNKPPATTVGGWTADVSGIIFSAHECPATKISAEPVPATVLALTQAPWFAGKFSAAVRANKGDHVNPFGVGRSRYLFGSKCVGRPQSLSQPVASFEGFVHVRSLRLMPNTAAFLTAEARRCRTIWLDLKRAAADFASFVHHASSIPHVMGSGTTGVACLNTGRNFIGIERDAAYVADARRRLGLTFELEAAD